MTATTNTNTNRADGVSGDENLEGFKTLTEWIEGPEKTSFFVKRWIPVQTPSCKLIFVHGFMEHITRYDHVFSLHAKAGIEVFSFDQRGFGETAAKTKTQGKTSWSKAIEDLNYFILREADPKKLDGLKVFLMGHSMGGGLAYAYPTRDTAPSGLSLITGGLVLSSPLIQQAAKAAPWGITLWIGSVIGAILPNLTMNVSVSPKDICRDEVVQEQYANDPLCAPIGTYKGVSDMILGGKKLLSEDYKNYPEGLKLLAVHGTGDNVTSCEGTENLIKKTEANQKEFKSFEGYYHEMHNEPGDLKLKEINFIIAWIRSNI